MAKDFKFGPMGRIYGSMIKAPFKLANLPFKSYRQYYGKPKEGEEYTGTFIQKQRLKKVLNLLFNGKNLSDNDRLFMNKFNDFLTSEGKEPIDQEHERMKCDDEENCLPYLYKKTFKPKTKPSDDGEENTEEESKKISSYHITFNDDLKLKNAKKYFVKGQTYQLSFLGSKSSSLGYDLYFRNRFFNDEDDFLIFKTRSKNPIGKFLDFKIYQDNKKHPLKHPIELGTIPAKIF